MALVQKYQAKDALTHAFEMVWTRAQLEFRYLRIGAASAHRFEELAPSCKIVSVASIFAEAILSIHRRESVSRLFEFERTE